MKFNRRSRFLKLALAMAVLPTLIMAVTTQIAVQKFDQQLTQEIKTQINEDIASLVEIYTYQGPDALEAAVDLRAKLTPTQGARPFYHLTKDIRRRSTGEITKTMNENGEADAYVVEVDRLVRRTVLKGGEILLVGRALDKKADALTALRTLFRTALALCIGLGLLVGLISAYLFRRRLSGINALCNDVAAGNVSARLPLDYSGDEISDLSQNINRMLDRIQKLIAARKRVSDSVAHELRTPLTMLDGALHRAQDAAVEPKIIETARGDLKDCVRLLDVMLDVSALEAQSEDKSDFEAFNLSQTVEDICDFYDALAEEKKQILICKTAPSCWVKGQPLQMGRLIANLVDNAIKYTPEAGRINVVTEIEQTSVFLRVLDTGPGIDPSQRDEVFSPFYRSKTRNISQGHGFGLALVKAIADRHDAEVAIMDNPGGTGAEFILRLPLSHKTK